MEEFNNNGERKLKDNNNTTNQFAAKTLDFLSGGGEMGKLIRTKDWSKTALGSPDTWPQSLRTAVSICIASNFPICISWGLDRVQIYNDGYWPITGDMHPASMGQDFKECWHSAWPVIGQAFEDAFLGTTSFLETQRIFLDRYGYVEETFFTFSFSPILDETGNIGGLFHPVVDQTQQTLAERRLNVLRAVADSTVNARTVEEACSLILKCLKDFELDIPFVLLYSIAADGKEANLQGSVGVENNSPLSPAKINLQLKQSGNWPVTEAIQNGTAIQIDELGKIFGTFHCGPYAEPPEQALVFPLTLHGTTHNEYFLVAGVSSRRSLDEKYRLFYELLAASVTNTLTKARAYEEERKKAEALAEIDKAKTVFFSNISHEFRTPLTLMLSPLEELLNQKNNHFSESEKQNIETAQRNAMRLLKLVNTLLDFSRIESGRQQAVFNLVDIVALTKNLAANFRSIIEKAGLKLIVKADTIIQPVYVDKQMWEKIVFNLLSNAFKYTLKGSITVALSAEEDFAVLKVKDTGVGIPENELPKMFERFHRVQNVTGRTYEGTGIGLSLIKELVQMHQGTINVESKLNEGSLFTVKIPTGKKHIAEQQISKTAIDSDEISSDIYAEEIETLQGTEEKKVSKISHVKEKNNLPIVLVVDDNADMRRHISSVLSNNFNVITANNGMDALHKMKETVPALVLSDIMMPVMDGIGLLKEIKNNKVTANIPVILLTARAGEESKIEGWETGADDYLIKPFSAKELVARVTAQIRMVKLRQSLEGNVRNLFLQSPAAIAVLKGPQHVFELANAMYLHLTVNNDLVGKSIRQAFPELEGTGIYELLDNVYSTGEPFVANEMLMRLDKGNEKLDENYFNFVYQPLRDMDGKIDGVIMHGVDITEQILARKKIEESEKRFSNLLMESPFAFAILKGKDMVVSLANDAIKRVWGKGSDIEGKSLMSIMPEIKEQGFAALLEQVYTTGKPFYGHEELIKLQRNSIWEEVYFNFIYQPYKEADETISGVTIIANEVTTQAIANKKIVASKENVGRLFMQAPAIICVLRGPQHIYELANAMYLQLVGNRDIVGKPIREALPELEGTGIFEILDKVYTTGEPFIANELPVTLLKESGKLEEGFFNFIYQASLDANGHIDGILVHAVEVTDQVLARKKIEESEQKFRLLADSMPQHIWTSDTDGNLNYFNKSVYGFSGLSLEEVNRDGWLQIVHPEDREENIRVWTESISSGKDFLFEHRFKKFDGEYRWQLSRAIPQMGEDGKIQMWVGTSTDIQDQKMFTNELERQVTERTKQIAQNNIELENMNKELRSFAYISSHDMQEPLRKIQIFSSQILEEELNNLSEKGKDKFVRMKNSANRMQTLIEDLLTYSRTATAERVFEMGNLKEIVEEVKKELQDELEEKNAIIDIDADCDFMVIPFQFRQLINNLVSNSLKFVRLNQDPHISITCTKAIGATLNNEKLMPNEYYWHIIFEDNGIGFEEQYSQRIFEVFQRLHGKKEYIGTGIGLAIVKKIVENHSGIIEARGEINKGATFNIYIPEKK